MRKPYTTHAELESALMHQQFSDRFEPGRLLGQELKGRNLTNPLVLAIPRGGVATGAALAGELGAELDVVLSRKLRSPYQPELALGAVGEDGRVHLSRDVVGKEDYLKQEIDFQLREISRRQKLFRSVRPQASVRDRSVILTDDGMATGSTMIAALQTVRAQHPKELIVAVPVAAPSRLAEVSHYCDDIVCLLSSEEFWAVGQFYEDFSTIEDEDVLKLLQDSIESTKLVNK